VCCSWLQCVAACRASVNGVSARLLCCSVLQRDAVCCSVMQRAAQVFRALLQGSCVAVYCLCCSVLLVLQCIGACVAVCCNVLHCVVQILTHVGLLCCSVLQWVAVGCSVSHKSRGYLCKALVLQCVAVCCSALQCVAVRCSVLQCVAVCCSVMQWIAQV